VEVPDVLDLDTVSSEPISHLPIGTQWPAGTGKADIVLLGSDAVLTIVETKLKRNPEARREVVAQVLEYAAFLSEWSGDQVIERARESAPKALADWLNDIGWDGDVESFTKQVENNLHSGRVRLIVAVDEVGEQAQRIITFLNANSTFDIYLLQVSSFAQADEGRILVPTLHGYARKTGTSRATRDWSWEAYERELGWSSADVGAARDFIERLGKIAKGWEPEVRLRAGWVGPRCLGRELFGVQMFKRSGMQSWFWLSGDTARLVPPDTQSKQTKDYLYLAGDLAALTDEQLTVLCRAAVQRRENERAIRVLGIAAGSKE
jgi:hypothetical protein